MLSAIIVAGGSSKRLGADKALALLNGMPVLEYSVRAFDALAETQEIILVARREILDEAGTIANRASKKIRAVILGGSERHLSVWEGIKAVPPEARMIAVHDAARPVIDREQIAACLREAERCGAASCATRVVETLKREDADGFISSGIDREGVWAMQTPQIFDAGLLRRAYAEIMAQNEIVTDETSAFERLGVKVKLVETPRWNMKITWPGDLEIAERLIGIQNR
jgi:2-C-methyl-D-erythritol 4-phosphate cytidylyltransferase